MEKIQEQRIYRDADKEMSRIVTRDIASSDLVLLRARQALWLHGALPPSIPEELRVGIQKVLSYVVQGVRPSFNFKLDECQLRTTIEALTSLCAEAESKGYSEAEKMIHTMLGSMMVSRANNDGRTS